MLLSSKIHLFCRTFRDIEYTPHQKLNIIIGPNGSGKSSIVTALILGFGGSPKDINRGSKVILKIFYWYLGIFWDFSAPSYVEKERICDIP